MVPTRGEGFVVSIVCQGSWGKPVFGWVERWQLRCCPSDREREESGLERGGSLLGEAGTAAAGSSLETPMLPDVHILEGFA